MPLSDRRTPTPPHGVKRQDNDSALIVSNDSIVLAHFSVSAEKKHAQPVTPSCTEGKTIRARAWREFPLTRWALRPRCLCSIVDVSFLPGDLRTVLVMDQIALSWICCGWPRLLISVVTLRESKLKGSLHGGAALANSLVVLQFHAVDGVESSFAPTLLR